jgi:deoxycytidylate deaminase
MHLLHTLKHNFLILGFTGPLRSGCTTAASFFTSDINKEIDKHLRTYDKIQSHIEKLYKQISKLKQTNSDHLATEKNALRDLLREREVLKVLKGYTDNQFVYISLTDMLIKAVVERVTAKTKVKCRSDFKPEKLAALNRLLQAIRSNYGDIKALKKLSRLIEDRRFSNLKEKDFKAYESYLERVKKTRGDLPQLVGGDELAGEILQDLGDNLRRCHMPFDYETPYDGAYPNSVFVLAEEANDVIKFFRSRERTDKTGQPRINHFVVEAFRNPYEVEFFRNRYYEFFLFSIYAGQALRESRAKFSSKRDERDRGESLSTGEFHKQNVSECVRLSDIAVNNEGAREDLHDKLLSFFALVKQPGCFAPRWSETAMHMAYSMSVRSTCISRQVGAVIEGANGYVVGAGWNDVGYGQIGCGYRHFEDVKALNNEDLVLHPEAEANFRRWLMRGNNDNTEAFCFKDKYSEYTIRKKLKKIERNAPKELSRLGQQEKSTLWKGFRET